MKRIALILLALLGSIAGVGVTAAVIGAFADPTGSLFAVMASMVWMTFGPFLLLTAIAALLAGVVLRRAGARFPGGLILVLSMIGVIGAGFILTRIGLVTVAAGGEINLRAVFMPGSMQDPPPDVVETFHVVEGRELRAAIYLPPAGSAPLRSFSMSTAAVS